MPRPSPIPVSTAETICLEHAADQVIIYARTVGEGGGEHVTTFGRSSLHKEVAARIGNVIGRGVVRPLDELREALKQALIWHEEEDKALSKGGRTGDDYRWRRAQHREQRDALEKALGLVVGDPS